MAIRGIKVTDCCYIEHFNAAADVFGGTIAHMNLRY